MVVGPMVYPHAQPLPPMHGRVEPPQTASRGGAIRVLESLKFLFSDDNKWHNILVSSVFLLIPFVGPIANMGWHAEIHQRLARRHPQPIPRLEFGDLGHYIGRGLAAFVAALLIGFVIGLPVMAVAYLLMLLGVFVVAGLAHATQEPILIPIAMGLVWLVLGALGFAVSLLVAGLSQTVLTRAELTEDVGAALNPASVLSYLRKTWWTLGWSLCVYWLLCVPLVLLGALTCGLGVYPAAVVANTGLVHLRWQVYDRHLFLQGAPVPLKPVQRLPSETPPAGVAGGPGAYGAAGGGWPTA